jgi:D-beta-D-heptose 7-phosphate kinase/D-beta-D-heptose 1-phosphate adenosyltransferase
MDSLTPMLSNSIASLTKAKVLCIGDVILDKFVYGDVARISPEAPIPVFNIRNDKLMLGGAGNVVCNLSGLGAKTQFIAVVGNDKAGKDTKNLMATIPNVRSTLIVEKQRRTSIKTRFVAGGQQMMRTDDETIAPIRNDTKQKIIKLVNSALNNCTALILSDYAKGVLTPEITIEIIRLAKKAGIPIVVDPQGNNYEQYKGADIVTPNRKELSLATNMPVNNEDQIITAARKLISKNKISFILATRSSDGMTLVDQKRSDTFKAEAREVFDVSGAGDTVVATIAASLSAGIDLKQAVRLANISAGIVVAKAGTAVAYITDIIQVLEEREFLNKDIKIFNSKSVLNRAKFWRSQNLKIGFTNGCFDLLHPGHIATISTAKAACDKLIIGLNNDSSVRRLKGKQRPIQTEKVRAQILTALKNVDAVVIFSENTPSKIIEVLKPDIFIKGADYKINEIPEARIVKSYGGEILLAELAEGHSTTATITQLKKGGIKANPGT